jgi:hypothetical protein
MGKLCDQKYNETLTVNNFKTIIESKLLKALYSIEISLQKSVHPPKSGTKSRVFG